jgi:hypothetical protein
VPGDTFPPFPEVIFASDEFGTSSAVDAETIRRRAESEAQFTEPTIQQPCCEISTGSDEYRLQRQIDSLSNFLNRLQSAPAAMPGFD